MTGRCAGSGDGFFFGGGGAEARGDKAGGVKWGIKGENQSSYHEYMSPNQRIAN